MTKRMAYGAALLACLLLWGCGGDGGVSQGVHDQTLQDLEALQAEIRAQEEAEAKEAARLAAEEAARKAAEAEEAEVTAQQERLTTLTETITALTTALAERQAAADEPEVPEAAEVEEVEEEEAEEEEEETTTTVTPPVVPQPTTPAGQTAEATQRAEHLMNAFGTEPTGNTNAQTPFTDSPVDMSVRNRGSLRLERSGYSPATLSGNGLRSATMALTGTGDTGKTVIYTDRELSRKLLDHYGSLLDATDMTRFGLTGALVITDGTTTGTIAHTTTPTVSTVWRISHDITTSVAAIDDDLTDTDTTRDDFPPTAATTKMRNSYTGYLHGLPGTFVCSVADCQVTVTVAEANYGALANGRYPLQTVIVGTTEGTGTENLRFKPSSGATLQLYEGGPVRADTEYMAFGYWREDPASPAGVYQYSVFADVVQPEAATDFRAIPSTFSATYDGTAVGAYVEKDPGAAVDTYRQGEFTADVQLAATGDTAVTGTIDDFVATPRGGSTAPKTADRWVVTLGASNAVSLGQLAGPTVGGWGFAFVPAHLTAATDTPPAVVGTFDARIAELVSIIGAFGATKR